MGINQYHCTHQNSTNKKSKQHIGLHLTGPGYLILWFFLFILNRQIPRPLLLFKLAAFQRPQKYENSEEQSGKNKYDEEEVVHYSVFMGLLLFCNV